MWLGLILGNKIIAGLLIALVTVPPVVYGGIKANEYRQVQTILQESKQLSSSGKYQEAENKLSEADNKWAFGETKREVEGLKEENKTLIQASVDYELGKELFDKDKYKDALEILKKVDSRNKDYPSARSLIELAEKKLEAPKGQVAGISTQSEVKVKTNIPIETPAPTSSPTLIPSPIPQPTSVIDPGKTAEMRNLIAEAKRLAAIRANAVVTLNWYQDQENQLHCSRPIYVDGTNIPLRPDQSEQIYQSCLSITQPYINQNSQIIADTDSKLRDLGNRLNILAAECPQCWEEAKK